MNKIKKIVIVTGFDTYEHRVELLRAFFVKNGCEVKVLASDWMHFHKEKRTQAAADYELVEAKPYYKNLSLQRLYSHYDFAQKVMQRVEELQPQLLWVLVPPNSLVKFSALYKKKCPNVKLVLDFMDLWPETMPISHFKILPPFTVWRNLRDKYIGYGDALVMECRLYEKVLSPVADVNKIHTLYLARSEEAILCEVQQPRDKIALCYLGSINHIIDIACIGEILQKVKLAMNMPVQLHIIGDGEKKDELGSVAERVGAEVIFHGKVYDSDQKAKLLCGCHFGLNIMKESVFVGLTMKSLDYFACGLPIINNIMGDSWDFVEENQIGINYSKETVFTKELLEARANCRSNVRTFFENYFSAGTFERKLAKITEVLDD